MRLEPAVKRFACTGCGKCCNRDPEVELAEAAALADAFVFRLMFRPYWLPDDLADFLALGGCDPKASAVFHGRKRLLKAFAARTWPVKTRRDGKLIRHTKYLCVSALALDTRRDACSALRGSQCGIYERRPLSCRSVPFHYSRVEALADTHLDEFVATPGYRCDTSESATIVFEDGRIASPEMASARAEAIEVARTDRLWARAITKRLGASEAYPGLPTLQEIDANAGFAATTTSMRLAWQIAVDIGLMTPAECARLVELQLQAIDQALEVGESSQDARETLTEMKAEYRRYLHGKGADPALT